MCLDEAPAFGGRKREEEGGRGRKREEEEGRGRERERGEGQKIGWVVFSLKHNPTAPQSWQDGC